MISPDVSRLVERQAAAYRVVRAAASNRPLRVCPVHPEYALEGGPVHHRCPLGHSVPAADINREVAL